MLKKIRIIATFFCAIIFLVCGLESPAHAGAKVLMPKIYQHLDIGVQLAYSGSDWYGRGLKLGSVHRFDAEINFTDEIEVVGAYPLLGNESRFDFYDSNSCTHNIPPGCDFATNYAPYSGSISNISARASGKSLLWDYDAKLVSNRQLGVVATVKKYMAIENGVEIARREIYAPLGGESFVSQQYPKVYRAISDAIRQAAGSDLGDNELTMFFMPIVFKYQKYKEAADLYADLDAPYQVKNGENYILKDMSIVDRDLTVLVAILEKREAAGKWREIARWQGSGKRGANTGGRIVQKAEKIGSDVYRLTVKTNEGKESSCIKSVIVTDGSKIEGKAILEAPKYSYEGHPFDVYDVSEFVIDGKSVSASKAYEEGIAQNSYKAPSGHAKRKGKDAEITFFKRGIYPVTLEVAVRQGGRLYDTKNVEILKTPFANVSIGGVQKQNRKQTFSANIATSPGKPIVSYELEVKDCKSGETAKLSNEKLKFEGNSIKTRVLKFEKKNEYFSRISLEFLTKYPNYFETGEAERKFSYVLKVQDLKGDVDIQYGKFSVRPDLPPNVTINMQDTFVREPKSDFAVLVAEDITKSDGDLFERQWFYSAENLASGEFKNFEDLQSQKGYKNAAIGTNQKVSWKKEGVGKFRLKLKIKEKWSEETLEEFISPDEYLQGEGKSGAEVVNIAPKVSITPIESTQVDLVITGGEAEIAEAKKRENKLQSELLEKGIDADISWINMRKTESNEDYYKRMAKISYTGGAYNSFLDSVYMLSDDDYVYSAGSEVEYDKSKMISKKPYQLVANSAFTGEKKWSFTVNDENCVANIDIGGKYFFVSYNNAGKTAILDRKTGQYIGEIPVLFQRATEIFSNKDGNSLYIINANMQGISSYNIAGNTLKKLTINGVYLARLQGGMLKFIEKTGQCEFFCSILNLETDELSRIAYPSFSDRLDEIDSLGKNEVMEIVPVDMDVLGNAVFSGKKYVSSDDNRIFSAWYANFEKKELKLLKTLYVDDNAKIFDFGGITNEKGEFTDCYSLVINYDSASNRKIGDYRISVLEFDGKEHEIYAKRKTASYEDSYMLLAKKNTKRNLYNFIKGAQISVWEYIYANTVSASGDDYKLLNNSDFAREILNQPENCYEQDDFTVFGKSYTSNNKDEKTIETYLPVSDEKGRFAKIFKKRAKLRKGVDRYLISLDAENNAVIADIISGLDKKVEFLADVDIESVSDRLEEKVKEPVGMLLLKGKDEGKAAKAGKMFKIDANSRYKYEYTLYQNVETADDILRIVPVVNNGEGIYKQIVEKQDFRLPFKNGFVKFNGRMLSEQRYARYTGFGAAAERQDIGAFFGLEFEMEKDGYLECDLFCRYESQGNYSVSDNYYVIAKGDREIRTPTKQRYLLKKGKHVIRFSVYSKYKASCEIGIKNLEIGYLLPNKPITFAKDIRKQGNGKFIVKGEFEGPLRERADNVIGDKRASDMLTDFEFVNDTNQDIRISNFCLTVTQSGKTGVEELEFEEFSEKADLKSWNIGDAVNAENAKVTIAKTKRRAEEVTDELVYKKGQAVRYKINYDDYEADPSKKQCFLYIHTPYNDGENASAFAIRNIDGSMKKIKGAAVREMSKEELITLAQKNGKFIYEKPIERFYQDGKYTVYHWQFDDTSRGKIAGGNPHYDKRSNICEITFYIGGTANAPWVKQISTVPNEVEAGKPFALDIRVDDIEKEDLTLITEVYKKGKRVFVHNKSQIKADMDGVYPAIDTGIVTSEAETGMYTVVCTVSDASSVGVSKHNFFVVDAKSIKGNVRHTEKWEKNRQRYNGKVCGKEFNEKIELADYLKQKKPRVRGSNVFWAGEKFVLNAEVSGKVKEVSCKIDGTAYGVKLKKTGGDSDKAVFTGVLWDSVMKKDWAGKPPREFTFTFTAKYEDGEIKEFKEKVIVGDSEDFRKLHRIW